MVICFPENWKLQHLFDFSQIPAFTVYPADLVPMASMDGSHGWYPRMASTHAIHAWMPSVDSIHE